MLGLSLNSHVIFGFILLLGLIAGQLARNTLYFPRITGYMFCGLLFGPTIFNIISNDVIAEIEPITDIAIAVALFRLGLQINYQYMKEHLRVVAAGIVDSVLTFTLVYLVLTTMSVDKVNALLVSIISIISLPVMNKLRGSEQSHESITRRALTIAAINNLFAFICFVLVIPYAYIGFKSDYNLFNILGRSVFHLAVPALLAISIGYMTIGIDRFVGKKENLQYILMAGTLILCLGTARTLGVSGMVSCLFFGIVVTNIDKQKSIINFDHGHIGEALFIILFVMTGAKMHLHHLYAVGGIALALVMIRLLSKFLTYATFSKAMGITLSQSYVLTLSLYPMAGLAISLVNLTEDFTPNLNLATTIVLASVAIIEITSTFLTKLISDRPENIIGAELLMHR